MLCQFTFKNFRSYKNETELDMQSASINEHQDTLITDTCKGNKYLPVSVIYGPNAGGKSNVIKALASYLMLIAKPVIFMQNQTTDKYSNDNYSDFYDSCTPFLFDGDSKNKATEFKMYFVVGNYEYEHKIKIYQQNIVFESLFRKSATAKKPEMIFTRSDNTEFGKLLKSLDNINLKINPSLSIISYIKINYDIGVINDICDWLLNSYMFSYSVNVFNGGIIYAETDRLKDMIIKLLNKFNIDIVDYEVKDKNKSDDINNINTIHKVDNQVYKLDLNSESEGSKKIIYLLFPLISSLVKGSLIVIDELDSKLHPKLLKEIISIFTNKEINIKGSQLIFTSHDMYTLSNEVFRRDEVWFATKDDNGVSDLYSLYDIKTEDNTRINASASFSRQYLAGRYGADPYFGKMEKWEV